MATAASLANDLALELNSPGQSWATLFTAVRRYSAVYPNADLDELRVRVRPHVMSAFELKKGARLTNRNEYILEIWFAKNVDPQDDEQIEELSNLVESVGQKLLGERLQADSSAMVSSVASAEHAPEDYLDQNRQFIAGLLVGITVASR